MTTPNNPSWFVIGYVRTIPGEHAFVFPVVQNGDLIEGKAYYGLNGRKLEFFEPSLQESIVRITPLEIPATHNLEDALPMYGYEYELGKVWIGDARQISKTLIDFACTNTTLTNRAKLEISDFVGRLLSGKEFISKNDTLLLGRGTLAGSALELLDDEAHPCTTIKIIGLAKDGYSVIEQMIDQGIHGIEYILIHKNGYANRQAPARHILVPAPGVGDDSSPTGLKSFVTDVRDAISDADMLLITINMNETEIGIAQNIAHAAREMGILTVGVVSQSFEWEGIGDVDDRLAELGATVNSLLVLKNERPAKGDQESFFGKALINTNEILKNAIVGIAEVINEYGHVNIDFEDVRTVMSEHGRAALGVATASGPDRARIAAEHAVLLSGCDLMDAKGILVLVTAAKGSLKLSESRLAMTAINAYVAPDAHVIYGAAYDDILEDKIRVTVLATGLSSAVKTLDRAPMTADSSGKAQARHSAPDRQNSNDIDIVHIPAYLKH